MAEDHRLGNAGGLGDLLGRRAAEPVLGEKADRRLEDLLAACVARHPALMLTIEKIFYQLNCS
jgi:hypothetical protein